MTFIVSDINNEMKGALVIISSIGKTYIGLLPLDDDGDLVFLDRDLVCIYNPFRYIERMMPGSSEGSININTQLDPVYYSLELVESMIFKYDSIYSLRYERDKDKRIGLLYDDVSKQALAKNSGLVAPTADDMRMINSGSQQEPR